MALSALCLMILKSLSTVQQFSRTFFIQKRLSFDGVTNENNFLQVGDHDPKTKASCISKKQRDGTKKGCVPGGDGKRTPHGLKWRLLLALAAVHSSVPQRCKYISGRKNHSPPASPTLWSSFSVELTYFLPACTQPSDDEATCRLP